MPESTWTIIILAVGMLIGTATTIRLNDIAYDLVLIWAYTGILIKHITASGFSGQYPGVIIAVSICLALFVVVGIFVPVNRKRRLPAQ